MSARDPDAGAPRQAWVAAGAYLVLTLIATWPLAAGLGRDVAWDLGDSTLNMWILSWDIEQFRAILGGDLSRLRSFFDANIFHPAPLTLAFSEHLVPQALQAFPIQLAGNNPILTYNLLYLSTYVLSGLGMYLLVRELTGSAAAGFVAGLVFAFAPYRIAQSPHLQALSSQWMPFALYGLRRYVTSQRVRALAGATAALVAQALSSGYYLLYFTPFFALFALWELWRSGLWRSRRAWLQLVAAGIVTVAAVLPFVLPYAAVRETAGATRPLEEVLTYSADVAAYATAPPQQRFWGPRLQTFPRPEGELFPGVAPLLLAGVGILAFVRLRRVRWLPALVGTLAAAHFIAALYTITQRRVAIDTWLFSLRMSDIDQLLLRAAILFGVLLLLSRGARAWVATFMRGPGAFAVALVAAAWLSLGPLPRVLGRTLELGSPYGWLLDNVPGFEGVRVPARFAMIVAAMLAVLAGYGAAVLARRRHGRALLALAAILVVLEGTASPFLINVAVSGEYVAPEPRVYRPGRAPAVYREFASRAADGVLVELPLGDLAWDQRATFYSIVHWRPVLNGYSGFYPPHYSALALALSDLPRHPELSLQAMRQGGATHAIVHEAAFRGEEGSATTAALVALGAVELFRDGSDVLLELPK